MNKNLTLIFLVFPFLVFSQDNITYVDADQFQVIGKISDATKTSFERLPASLEKTIREDLWRLGKSTAGIAVRFKTNSTSISAKWEVLRNTSMNHMTDVGIKGLDLYSWEDNHWRFVNSAKPKGKTNELNITRNMHPVEREFLLFLPLYDGVISLSIGIDANATISQPTLKIPNTEKPIIFYGTSITQGGCASRPGMAYTNILSRWLNTEVINLGFSGNGRLDYEIAELMASKKNASLFVLDFLPNASPTLIEDHTLPFIDIIRKSHPDTPILLVENMKYPTGYFNQNIDRQWEAKNRSLGNQYDKLKKRGDRNIHYLEYENLIGRDGEGTVDGTHFNDIGFFRYSEILQDKIKDILN